MKTALLQMDVKMYDREANKAKIAGMMQETIARMPEVDLFVFPELWTFPFIFGAGTASVKEQLAKYGEEPDGETLRFTAALAKKHGVWIAAGSLPIRHDDGVYRNTMAVFDRNGVMADCYSKIHLCGWCGETNVFANGREIKVIDTELGRLAPAICYDIRFPEAARSAAVRGADILVAAADFGHNPDHPKVEIWRTLLKARAMENMMFVVACDRCGEGPESSYFGHSMIIDPYGRVIAEGDEKEGVIVGDIDLKLITEARQAIPVFSDRQPNAYTLD